MLIFNRGVLLFFIGLAVAATAAAGDMAVTFTPMVVSQYMFRGVRLGGPSFEPTLELAAGDFGVGIWANAPIADKVPGVSDPEIDPYAYYTISVNDHLSIVPGITVYTYPRADESAGSYKTTLEPYLGVNYTVGSFTIAPKVYYDTVLKGPTFEVGLTTSVPLAEQKTSLDFAFVVGTYWWNESVKDANPAIKNRGDYVQAGVTMPFKLNEKAKLTLGVMYVRGFNNRYESNGLPDVDNTAAVGRVVATVGCAFSF